MNTIDKYKKYVDTNIVSAIAPLVFDRAEGALVFGEDGRKFIDCFAGIAVTCAGHSNPEVIEAAKAQLDKYIHCCSYVYHNKPMADLAEKLAEITPGRLNRTFFANSGSEAIECALRLAKIYNGKHEFIALQAGFHGRTYAALSISGNYARKTRGGPYMPGVSFAPPPYCYRCTFNLKPQTCGMHCAEHLDDIIKLTTSGDVCAFIAEPVMGEGGIISPPEAYFKKVKEVLDHHKIMLVIDEVQSGFARTGKMFAIEHYGVEPDIMAMAKGIANGLPLSGCIARDEIADAFRPEEHLSTFGGNPVSCAASLATINFLQRERIAEKVMQKETLVKERLASIKENHRIIGDVRGRGLMIGVELVKDDIKTPAASEARAISQLCLKQGLLVGVGGILANVLRIQPPLVITDEQLDEALGILEKALEEF
ncbi:aspartate aminotransferase family protein [Chloroflexota bacterium]